MVIDVQSDVTAEIATGQRFAFGENWARFVDDLGVEQIRGAVDSLTRLLGTDDLRGRHLVDVGCGSGLVSLAARTLGAQVVSFDADPAAVAAARALRARAADFSARGAGGPAADDDWRICEGSVLDVGFLSELGAFDIVYSWGVLHHTGRMWESMERIQTLAAADAILAISLYNDQGAMSRIWRVVKRRYVAAGPATRAALTAGTAVALRGPALVRSAVGKGSPRRRGMSARRDLRDWVGGYPFEVAKPEEVFRFYRDRGWTLRNLTTVGGRLGCNEYVFQRGAMELPPANPGPRDHM